MTGRNHRFRPSALRPVGAMLLIAAYFLTLRMLTLGRGHAGHEPAIIYLLALIDYVCASAGAALLLHGPRLFDRVEVGTRWITHAEPVTPPSDGGLGRDG